MFPIQKQLNIFSIIFIIFFNIFLPDYFTLQIFRKNILIYNKSYILSRVIGISSSKTMLLLLNKTFLYLFSICQQVKCIDFKEITTDIQELARWIKIFQVSYLQIVCNNFAVTQRVHKNFICREAMKPLRKIVIVHAGQNIEVQMHCIITRQNCLANMLSRSHYTKITHKYYFLQIVLSTSRINLKASIWKYLLNKC